MSSKFAIISGIGAGDSGVGRLIDEFIQQSVLYDKYNVISLDQAYRDDIEKQLFELHNEVLLLIHPQTLGFDLFLHLVRNNKVFFFVMDNSFFCIKSYNYIDRESKECLRCLNDFPDTAISHGCDSFPVHYSREKNLQFIQELRNEKNKISFLVQNAGQEQMIDAFYGPVNCHVIGLKTSDMKVPVYQHNNSYRWDCVFHGASDQAKGLGFCIELARRMPETRFFIPVDKEQCAIRLGIQFIPGELDNVSFRDCRWESGLQEEIQAAKIVLNLSLWSASIEGAVIKSLLYNGCVAVNTPKYAYAHEIPDNTIVKLDSQKPDESAWILTTVLDNKTLLEKFRKTGRKWANLFVENSTMIANVLTHTSKSLIKNNDISSLDKLVESFNKREKDLAVFKKMHSFKGFFSTELINIVLNKKHKLSVFLFGAGKGGKDIKSFLEESNKKLNSNFNFLGLMDNNQSLWGNELNGLQIVKPSYVSVEVDYILVASLWGNEIKQQLLALGVEKKQIILCY